MTRFYLFSPIIILLAFTLLTATSCTNSQDREADKVLNAADAVMFSRPDSALQILTDLDTTSLSDSRIARYALLMTKAQMKCNVRIGSDSLIRIAKNYYAGKNDTLEMQSLCYYGEIAYYYQHELGEGLVSSFRAYNMAKQMRLPFYCGLSARVIANIYGLLYKNDEEEKWIRIARSEFINAGCERHTWWTNISLMNCLMATGKIQETEVLLARTDSNEYLNHKLYRQSILKIKAEIANEKGKFSEADSIYKIIIKDKVGLNSLLWCKYAKNCIDNRDLTNAATARDSALMCSNNNQTKLYCDYLSARIYNANGDVTKAFDTALKWGESVDKEADNLLNEEYSILLNKYLTSENESIKTESDVWKLRTIGIVTITIILIIFIVLFFAHIKVRRKVKVAQNELLKIDIVELRKDIDCLTEQLNNKIKDTEEHNVKEESAKLYLETLNAIYENSYKYLSSDNMGKRLPSDIKKTLEALQMPENIEKLNSYIDIVSRDWMIKFKQDFPGLIESHYNLARYLYAKFGSSAMAILLNRPNKEAVYKLKNRFKAAMIETNPEKSKHYLAILGFNVS